MRYDCIEVFITDGTPCAVKVACTVWTGGKSGDNFKGLPIRILDENSVVVDHLELDDIEIAESYNVNTIWMEPEYEKIG